MPQTLAASDRVGLRMAADSFRRKLAQHVKPRPPVHRRLLRLLLGR